MPIVLNFVATKDTTIRKLMLSKHFSEHNIFDEIHDENVYVNNSVVKSKNHSVQKNDVVKITLNDEINELKENSEPINIIYEDDYFLVVDKPSNLDVEPSRYTETNNLASRITYYYNQNGIKSKIHLVNRLDNLTSGLVIVAKNRYIKHLFSYVKINKKYKALCEGKLDKEGYIEIGINRIEHQSKRVVDNENGKLSKTKYQLISYDGINSLVDVTLLTGRTHQIRLSMSHIGHPLIGDPLYNPNFNNEKMLLRAYSLSFIHPVTDKEILLTIE